jgi:hypothetical protein
MCSTGIWIWPLLPSSSSDKIRSKAKTAWGASPMLFLGGLAPLCGGHLLRLCSKPWCNGALSWSAAASYLHGLPPVTSAAAESSVGWCFGRMQRPQRACTLFPCFVGASV